MTHTDSPSSGGPAGPRRGTLLALGAEQGQVDLRRVAVGDHGGRRLDGAAPMTAEDDVRLALPDQAGHGVARRDDEAVDAGTDLTRGERDAGSAANAATLGLLEDDLDGGGQDPIQHFLAGGLPETCDTAPEEGQGEQRDH